MKYCGWDEKVKRTNHGPEHNDGENGEFGAQKGDRNTPPNYT